VDDDAGMMAAMGLTGFGSTKVLSLLFPFAFFDQPIRVNMWMAIKKARPMLRKFEHGDST